MASKRSPTEAHGLLSSDQKTTYESSQESDKIQRSGVGLDLSMPTISLFILGKIAGVGILALPKAVSDTGIWGVFLLLIYFAGSIYSGLILARNWNMLIERDPRVGTEISRDPYPLMAFHAFGIYGRWLGAAVLYSSIIFGVTADILLVSENLQILFRQLNINLAFCYWLPIVTYLVCPLTWFGTPKDFWLIGITAGLTSMLSSLLVIIGTSFDVSSRQTLDPVHVDFWPFCAALGLVAFAYSGQSVFPTLQHDMKRPANFRKSVVLGYIIVALCYFPSSLFAYWVYGAEFQRTGGDNVFDFFTSQPVVIMCILSLNTHLILSVVIDTNPFNQDIEDYVGIPYDFTWKRCISRSLVMTVVLLLAFLVPKFSTFISIFGAPLTVFGNFVIPSLVHLKLRSMLAGTEERWIGYFELSLHIVVNTLAVIGGSHQLQQGCIFLLIIIVLLLLSHVFLICP
ncbi:uncharacterized protein [Amphiura filiformis]|uniref:uncharacterized protein n=1 Tax=Amphiura filiformis TaxID=82378 RepID=UPI003B2155AA